MPKTKKEATSPHNPNILRVIPDWRQFYKEKEHTKTLETNCVVAAQGGTFDSIKNEKGALIPVHHPVTIDSTEGKRAAEIARLFITHSAPAPTLGNLYAWSLSKVEEIPWIDIQTKLAVRISSFDSSKEEDKSHALGEVIFGMYVLKGVNNMILSKGTDGLMDNAALEAIILYRYLIENGKKAVMMGSKDSGYEEGTDAIANMNGGLYAILEKELAPGLYIVSSKTTDGDFETQILPGLGSVKWHSDGIFHAPNTGPILTIKNGIVYVHPLFYELKKRLSYASLLPDFLSIYLQSNEGIKRLENALEKTVIETVKNPPYIMDYYYQKGVRSFVVKAKGTGNGRRIWKEKIEEILAKGDTTVIVITLGDSGDVNLEKYEAGLHVPGVLSGRTLREEAAFVLAAIINDLKLHKQLSSSPQKLIEIICYLSGMIELPHEEIAAFPQNQLV